jgi:ubiquinone/menaquinone biosynthesis C-methylase UbiE
MNEKYAQKLLLNVESHYSSISEKFSRTREVPWMEMKFLFDCYINENDRVLDLGCGNGRFYELIRKKVNYFGLDNSNKLISIAKKKYPEAVFRKGDVLKIPFPDNSFDKIFSISVLHHIPSQNLREKFIEECERVLKKDGLLIITVWDLWQKTIIRKKIIKNYFLKLIGKSNLDFNDAIVAWHGISNCYVHCFKLSELKKLVEKNGFKIIDSGTIRIKNKKSLSNFYIVAKNITA